MTKKKRNSQPDWPAIKMYVGGQIRDERKLRQKQVADLKDDIDVLAKGLKQAYDELK